MTPYFIAAAKRDLGIGWNMIDRATALAIWKEAGYDAFTFACTEQASIGVTFKTCPGYTHRKENNTDHWWRIVVVEKQWYFAITD